MRSTASRARIRPQADASSRSPLSVTLPAHLRKRLAAEAKRRQLKVATTARLLIDERMNELEESTELRRAEEWQLGQALATWRRIQAGDRREVSTAQIDRLFADARAKVATKTRRSA